MTHDLAPRQPDCSQSDLDMRIETTPSSFCGVADGSIAAFPEGGVPPYSFRLNNTVSPSGIFTNLLSGVYSVTVIDDNGCEATTSNVTISSIGVQFAVEVEEDTDCAHGNGSIDIQVTEGQSFQFKFGEEPFTADGSFDMLESGSYEIILKDANDCSTTLNVTVQEGASGTSWSTDIRPIVVSSCALSGCHNGVSRPDLRLYEKAKFYANQMKELTLDRSMPFEGSITQEQIDLIGCWVDEGAKEN